jgi:hypothetical protein
MLVSSPGGDMPIRQLCPKVNLKIRRVDFVANLINLESKGTDVILGMDWLSKHNVLIDCAKKSVKLTTPEGKEMEFVTEPVVTAKGVAISPCYSTLLFPPATQICCSEGKGGLEFFDEEF